MTLMKIVLSFGKFLLAGCSAFYVSRGNNVFPTEVGFALDDR